MDRYELPAVFFNFINKELRKMREEAGLLQEQLARRLGVTDETIKAIESDLPGVVQSMDFNFTLRWQAACYKSMKRFLASLFLHVLPWRKRMLHK